MNWVSAASVRPFHAIVLIWHHSVVAAAAANRQTIMADETGWGGPKVTAYLKRAAKKTLRSAGGMKKATVKGLEKFAVKFKKAAAKKPSKKVNKTASKKTASKAKKAARRRA